MSTSVLEFIELESITDDATRCEYRHPECDARATWVARATCCGDTADMCAKHKGATLKQLAWMASKHFILRCDVCKTDHYVATDYAAFEPKRGA